MILVLLLAASCATWRSGDAKHPVPPAIERLPLDRCWIDDTGLCNSQPGPQKEIRISLRSEPTVSTHIAYTATAWLVEQQWIGLLIRAYCEGRETLQLANGEEVKPEGVCKP